MVLARPDHSVAMNLHKDSRSQLIGRLTGFQSATSVTTLCLLRGLSIADILKSLGDLGSTTDVNYPPMAQRPGDHLQPHNVTPLDETNGESQQVGNSPAIHQDMSSSPSYLQRYPGNSSLDNLEVECEAKSVGGTSGSLELPDVVGG